MDWQSVKITEECGKPDPNAYNAHGNGYEVGLFGQAFFNSTGI
jgi:hypothetical protein